MSISGKTFCKISNQKMHARTVHQLAKCMFPFKFVRNQIWRYMLPVTCMHSKLFWDQNSLVFHLEQTWLDSRITLNIKDDPLECYLSRLLNYAILQATFGQELVIIESQEFVIVAFRRHLYIIISFFLTIGRDLWWPCALAQEAVPPFGTCMERWMAHKWVRKK